MIDLVNYNVGMMEGFLGTVPGISNISIKNNGDKQIDSLTLGIDFLDETGSISYSGEIIVLGIFNDPISAGYSWKMENNRYYDFKNLADEVDISRNSVKITAIKFE